MQQNSELGNVGQHQIFLHFWVHFLSPTPLSTYKGHLNNFSFTRYHNSIWWKASLINRLGNNLWIAPCYCSLILPHPIHLYCILISVVLRSGAGRPGALRGGAKPIFAPAGALGRGEAILRPGWGVGAGRGHFAPRAGALGRVAYVFWALWCAPRPGALAAPL